MNTYPSISRCSIVAVASCSIATAGLLAAGPATADPAGSYPLSSSSYSISPASHSTHTGYCADGYHVSGQWKAGGHLAGPLNALPPEHREKAPFYANLTDSNQVWNADVSAHGDWISVWDYSGQQLNGTDSHGNATYQGVSVTLYNSSLISHHDGSFSWVCDPN
ncbi:MULTISPECIES: hypothetical protein [Actinomycetes]|uniref:hypothetical protein n=1 Tax=Actinomycetes TaxID=1760 RepID=UPI0004C08758|nr:MULTISPECIES: hypothetical protein [Actinomycetes]